MGKRKDKMGSWRKGECERKRKEGRDLIRIYKEKKPYLIRCQLKVLK